MTNRTETEADNYTDDPTFSARYLQKTFDGLTFGHFATSASERYEEVTSKNHKPKWDITSSHGTFEDRCVSHAIRSIPNVVI